MASKIKLPDWKADNPRLWFRMAEMAFRLDDSVAIDKKKQMSYICSVIPMDVVERFEAVFATDDYNKVKAAIIGSVQKSDSELFDEMNQLRLGDQKPSVLAQQVALKVPENPKKARAWIIQQTVMRQLPSAVKAALANEANYDLDNPQAFLDKLDKVYIEAKARPTVAAIEEADEIAAIKRSGHGGGRGGKKAGGRGKECFYHSRFKGEAYKCDGGDCPSRNKPLAKKPEKSSTSA